MPNLGSFVNRMPTYTITRPQYSSSDDEPGTATDDNELSDDKLKERPNLEQVHFTSMSSVLPGPKYAVLPGGQVEGWSREDYAELNDHVRHMLHSRRSKFKRAMKGFRQYIKKRERSSSPRLSCLILMSPSPRLSCDSLRNFDHSVRSGLGSFLDW